MNLQWNTRKFPKTIGNDLCNILQNISAEEQVLLVQPKVLALLNEVLSFSQLTERTPVRKIVSLGPQALIDIKDNMESDKKQHYVFLIDIRSDITVPKELKECLNSLKMRNSSVIFSTWRTQISNSLLSGGENDSRLSHFIKSQLKAFENIEILPWFVLPVPQIDDNLLLCEILFNNDGENMYFPSNCSMQVATRSILLDNMVNCLQSLIKETGSKITHTVGFGDTSNKFLSLLRKRIDNSEDINDDFINDTLYGEKYSGLEKDLIVIERDIDPLTPLLTQLTYAGILDDLHEITAGGKLKGDDSINLKYQSDEIWDQLKYMNFGALGPQLNQMARELQERYDSRHKAESVGEIRQFVDSLGTLQERQKLLKMHTTLSSNIVQDVADNEHFHFNQILELEQELLLQNLDNKASYEAIMDLVYGGQVDLQRILRLVCISSICKNGLRDKDYESMKLELTDSFGIEVCFQLQRLTLSGLFSSKYMLENTAPSVWKKEYRYISSWLDTLPPDEDKDPHITKGNQDASNPKDATFAYCGVVPLTTRFVQLLYDRTVLTKNYSSQQPFIVSREPSIAKTGDLFEQIFGKPTAVKQERWLPPIRKNKRRVKIGSTDKQKSSDISIIVFLGGITLGEVSTIRYLQDRLREKGVNKRFILVGDGLINGNRIIDSSTDSRFRNSKISNLGSISA